MKRTVSIGIIGDYDEKRTSHPAMNRAIQHAADYLSLQTNVTWLPTPAFLKNGGLEKKNSMLSGHHRAAPTGAWREPLTRYERYEKQDNHFSVPEEAFNTLC